MKTQNTTCQTLVRSRFRVVQILTFLCVALLVLQPFASASTVTGSFELNGGGYVKDAKGDTLCWDTQEDGTTSVKHNCFKIDTSKGTGENGNVTNADIAGQLANNINGTNGAGTATADGNEVQIPGYFTSDQLGENHYAYGLHSYVFGGGFGVSIQFNPDLSNGNSVLTAPSSFQFLGPNLNVAFADPACTTIGQLAQQLGSLMPASYNPTVNGSDVNFDSLAAGDISFYGWGAGIDLAFGSTATPEPSSLFLLGTGILGLSGFLRKRLRT